MAFLETRNVMVKGVSACVPSRIEENAAIANIDAADIERLIKNTGIERRHIRDGNTCTSDLCFMAAEKLISQLNWDKNDIDGLVFVTQTPDYILPATSCILQHRLNIPTSCLTLDVSLGCSGFVYGLSTIASYMQSGAIKKALLLTGDTSSMTCSTDDKSTYPLFGDAGTALALEYCKGHEGMKFHLGSDGAGFETIIIQDGGYRNPVTPDSIEQKTVSQGIKKNNLQLSLEGMDVFSFGISKAPETVKLLIENYCIPKEDIDLFFFHQANNMMNERIRVKLQLPKEKTPNSLRDFGNTSSASIPLTMVTQAAQQLKNGKNQLIACGFGVGLSWGTVKFNTDSLIIPELAYYG